MTLSEPHTFRRQWETACNYTDVTIPAGEYPLEIRQWWINGRRHRKVTCSLAGTVSGEFSQSRLLGFSSIRVDENVGKSDIWSETVASKQYGEWRCGAYGPKADSLRTAIETFCPKWGTVRLGR